MFGVFNNVEGLRPYKKAMNGYCSSDSQTNCGSVLFPRENNFEFCRTSCQLDGYNGFTYNWRTNQGYCEMGTYYTSYRGTYCGQGGSYGTGNTNNNDYSKYEFYCPSGTYNTKTACKSCTAGRYVSGDSFARTSCTSCSAGYYSSSSASSCSQCSQGKYSGAGASSCTSCPIGYYQDGYDPSHCKQCPTGRIGVSSGTRKWWDCPACPVAYYQNEKAKTSCKRCATGTFGSSTGSSTCDYCAVGRYQNQETQTSCKLCAAGRFQVLRGQTACTACNPGYFEPDTGSPVCDACSAGLYQDEIGQQDCKQCAQNRYQHQSGQTICIDCPENTTSSAGAVSCCGSGSYYDQIQTQKCYACAPGYYAPDESVFMHSDFNDIYKPRGPFTTELECVHCGVNKYQNQHGQTSCQDCPTGWVQNDRVNSIAVEPLGVSDKCVDIAKAVDPTTHTCPVGYQYTDAQCNLCPPGRYQSETGTDSCNAVPKGSALNLHGVQTAPSDEWKCTESEYQDQVGQTECKKCAAGYFSDTKGAETCTVCPPGKSSDSYYDNNNNCYIDESFNVPVCGNWVGTKPDKVSVCQSCDPGKYSPGASTPCNACPVGYYQSQSSSASCVACDAGTYSVSAAATSVDVCTNCGAGKYNAYTGAGAESACTHCAHGRYNPLQKMSSSFACLLCPHGFYQDTPASTACIMCSDTKMTNDRGSVDVSDCKECPLGQFSATYKCYTCFPGRYKTGDTCQDCPSGKMSNTYDAPSCSDCVYQDEVGQQDCKVCPTSHYVSNGDCRQCPSGRFTESPNAVETFTFQPCIACPRGKFMNSEYSSSLAECAICPHVGTTYMCSDGYEHIVTNDAQKSVQERCEDTAKVLRDVEFSIQDTMNDATKPYGCYLHNSNLYVNTNPTMLYFPTGYTGFCHVNNAPVLARLGTCDGVYNGPTQIVAGGKVFSGAVQTMAENRRRTALAWDPLETRAPETDACLRGQYFSDPVCETCVQGQYSNVFTKSTADWSMHEAVRLGRDIDAYLMKTPTLSVASDGQTAVIDWGGARFGLVNADTQLDTCLDICDKDDLCDAVSWAPPYINGDYVHQRRDTRELWNVNTVKRWKEVADANYKWVEPDFRELQDGLWGEQKDSADDSDVYLRLSGALTRVTSDDQDVPLVTEVASQWWTETYKTSSEPVDEWLSLKRVLTDDTEDGRYVNSIVHPERFNALSARPNNGTRTKGACFVSQEAPQEKSRVYVLYQDAFDTSDAWSGTIAGLQPNTDYHVQWDVLRAGLASGSARVTSVTMNGVPLGGCNPATADDYACDFVRCPSSTAAPTPVQTNGVGHIVVEATYQNVAIACDCDLDIHDGRCADRRTQPPGYTDTKAALRFTVAPPSNDISITTEPGFWLTCQRYGKTKMVDDDAGLKCRAHLVHTYTKSNCMLCPAGKFNAADGARECTDCPRGKSSTVGQNRCVKCSECEPGETLTSNGCACEKCSRGKAYNATTTACESCEPGTYALEGATSCKECIPGRFSASVADTTVPCRPCECPFGQKIKNLDAHADRTSCDEIECDACPVGTFQDTRNHMAVCKPCGPHQYSDTTGQTVCADCVGCATGHTRRVTGKTSLGECETCTVCRAGHYCSDDDHIERECPRGTYQGTTGQTTCEICPQGYFSTVGASSCSACLPGTSSEAGTGYFEHCVQCAAGKYESDHLCVDCAPGKNSGNGALLCCDACPPGEAREDSADPNTCTACTPCPVGHSCSDDEEIPCPAGTYQDQTGQTTCKLCSAGQTSTEAQETCNDCAVGHKCPGNGDVQTPCPAGSYQDETGQTTCKLCSAGQTSTEAQETCNDCAVGHKCPGNGDVQTPCPAGSYQNQPGQTTCKACQAGHISGTAAATCTPCEVGRYCTDNVQRSCAAGTYQDQTAQTECKTCAVGSISDNGQSACDTCALGHYCLDNLQRPCPSGTYQDEPGQTTCKTCAEGKNSGDGSTLCYTAVIGNGEVWGVRADNTLFINDQEASGLCRCIWFDGVVFNVVGAGNNKILQREDSSDDGWTNTEILWTQPCPDAYYTGLRDSDQCTGPVYC